MTIPGYQDMMLPLLEVANDGETHKLQDLVDVLAGRFALRPDELDARLPSGTQRLFANRVNWAATYLRKAGLLESPARGQVRITKEGCSTLASPPSRIDRAYLLRYPAFAQFVGGRPAQPLAPGRSAPPEPAEAETPLERMNAAANELEDALADELLAKVKLGTPKFFERLVVELLQAMGYGGSRTEAAQVLGGSGDAGIDGVIKQDRLGLEAVYVQAKRWENTVGRPTVQAFAGSLDGARARKGVLMTTAEFSQEARDYVRGIEKRIVLISGEQLVDLMIEHGIGVSTEARFEIRRIDSAYFEEG
jgi:restriction system protein